MSGKPASTQRGWLDAAAVLCGLFAYSMLETMIGPALPEFQRVYGASPSQLGSIVAGLLLVGAIAMPLVGRLGDLYDKRHVLVGTLGVASVGIVISACANDVPALALGQALQGVAMGVMPVAVGMMKETLPMRAAVVANGLIVGAAALSTAAGLIAAGPIIERLGLHAIYWLPLGLIVPCLLWLALPRGGPAAVPRTSARLGDVDWIGAGSLALLLLALLAGLGSVDKAGWQSPATLGPLAAFALLLPLWIRYERRQASPMLDTRLLGLPGIGEISVIALAVGFGSAATYTLLPMLMQSDPATGIGFGASTTTIGQLLVPVGIAGLAVAPFVGAVERKSSPRMAVCLGVLLTVLGAGLPALLHAQAWHLAVSATALGAGAGISLTAAMNTVVRSVPVDRAASTVAAVLLIRTLGSMLGAQLCMTVLSAGLRGPVAGSATSRFTDAFALSAAGCALALIAVWRFPRGATSLPLDAPAGAASPVRGSPDQP